MAEWISRTTRDSVANRASLLCEYCKAPRNYSPSPFNVEHIVPISRGGDSHTDNLAHSCHGCNCLKSDKVSAIDPVSDLEVPLFHPRRDEWSDHFVWDASGLLIIGTTPTGRATVDLLKLDRPELINLRSLLVMVGKHPPK